MTQSMIIMRLCKYVQAMQNEPVYNNIIIYNIYNIITDIKSDLLTLLTSNTVATKSSTNHLQ
jgi:hypothetical protein